ncbi:MAG: hypothetical protein EHM58_13540 [Ignavibacteriae bacterium]|nr:MAG: hypothetical protein EHM58_13540 [Ignavibacteriota bacterium]
MAKILKTNCPFTLTEYRALIKLAKKRFPFVSYTDYNNYDKFVIWRHDVEYCTTEMNKLAEINTEEGIKSTFFVQLHCNYYNFWDKANVKIFKSWVEKGHDIGLHFDCGFHGENVFEKIEELIGYEKNILENALETKVQSFAYHNPVPEALRRQDNYAGLINAYNKDLFKSDVMYVSDSNGRWRERTIRDVLEDENIKKAQINTHDTWWVDDRIPQIEKLEKALRKAAEDMITFYKENAKIVVKDII